MEYIEKNINLYRLKTGVQLTTRAAANFTRYVCLILCYGIHVG